MSVRPAAPLAPGAERRVLFHQLNTQLGIILAHAELLETRAESDAERARAVQIVASAIDAMTTVKALRELQDRPESEA